MISGMCQNNTVGKRKGMKENETRLTMSWLSAKAGR